MSERWEYLIEAMRGMTLEQIEERLNALGEQEWQAFTAYPTTDYVLFKRRLKHRKE